MRTIRLYCPVGLEVGADEALDARAAHRLGRVLRRRVGDRIVVFNGNGHDAECVITDLRGTTCRVRVDQVVANDRESPVAVTLVQALARGEKMDWVIQKAVELGVAAIRPVDTEHAEVRLDSKRAEKRLERWREIIAGACEQSGRARLPSVETPVALDALDLDDAHRLMLDPTAQDSLARHCAGQQSLALAVGPEGGFGPADRAALARLGFVPVRLGPRVLRTETAGAAALAVVQAIAGDLG